MQLAKTISALSLVLSVVGRPAGNYVSILTGGANAIKDLPFGKTAVSREDMTELARLAIAVK